MLNLDEIRSFYPEVLHRFPRFMLREYFQFKILEIIYDSKYSNTLCFMGGTCLRIVHNNRRFSEDLDFDNIGLQSSEFDEMADIIGKELKREGYKVEFKTIKKGAWHCHIKFPGLLFEENLSGYREEKILIRFDTEPQNYDYQPDKPILNKFDIFTTILSTPLPVLLSQKLFAIINRKRKQGRDFYDTVFLLGKDIKPDYNYLDEKAGITNSTALKSIILDICNSLNMRTLAKDVEPFIFNTKDIKKVELFPEYIKQTF